MPLVRNANSSNVGFRVQTRGHSQSLFKNSFLDLGNLSEMSFRVFSGTTVEKRGVFFWLPWNVMVTNWREFVRATLVSN
jgi:hypothetical protein